MQQVVRFIAGVLGTVIVLSIITIVLLATFVSPNRFKPLITEQVKKATGRNFIIDGDLAWSFFPNLGVKVGHMALSNPPGFQQPIFAEIDHAIVSVKLLPLLHAQFQSSGVSLKGVNINLIKNAEGRTNWPELSTGSPSKQTQERRGEELGNEGEFGVAISALNIGNANISYVDEQNKNNFAVNNFELHARDINLNKPFPISSAFNFTVINPAVSGHISLQSKITLNLLDQIYLLKNTYFAGKINNIDLNAQGNIIANQAKQTLQLEDLTGQIAILSLSGKVNVTNLNDNPQMNGHIQINPVDFKAWLQSIGQTTADIQEMKNVAGHIDFSLKKPNLFAAQGKFSIDSLQTAKIRISEVKLEMHYKNNIVDLLPLTAKLYQGDLYSQIKINLTDVMPHFSLQANLSNIQAEPLLEDLGAAHNKIKFSGMGNVDMQVTTAGIDATALARNLNGSGTLHFTNGVLKGIDMSYLIDSAYALAKRETNTTNNSEQTNFGSLTGSINIHDGVISNNDLHFDAPRFNTIGKGKIDLLNQQIQYSLQTQVKKTSAESGDDLYNFYGLSLPILITGNLDNPSIRLDTDLLLGELAKNQFKNAKVQVEAKLKDKINEKAKDLLGNILGS